MVDKVLKKPQWLKVSSVGAMTSFDPPNLRLIDDYPKMKLNWYSAQFSCVLKEGLSMISTGNSKQQNLNFRSLFFFSSLCFEVNIFASALNKRFLFLQF